MESFAPELVESNSPWNSSFAKTGKYTLEFRSLLRACLTHGLTTLPGRLNLQTCEGCGGPNPGGVAMEPQ